MVHHLVIVIAECPQLWKNLHKIRINYDCATKQHFSPLSSSQDILYGIVSYLNKFDQTKSYVPSNVYVEIYNDSSCRFVPLLGSKLDGTRFRCIIHIVHLETFSQQPPYDSSNTNVEPLLQIKGRYFDYNPNGMGFAGTRLIIKEESNNKDENGTGLNVWDGSLLLARYLEKNPSKVGEMCSQKFLVI